MRICRRLRTGWRQRIGKRMWMSRRLRTGWRQRIGRRMRIIKRLRIGWRQREGRRLITGLTAEGRREGGGRKEG
jgi:hypothetical protein